MKAPLSRNASGHRAHYIRKTTGDRYNGFHIHLKSKHNAMFWSALHRVGLSLTAFARKYISCVDGIMLSAWLRGHRRPTLVQAVLLDSAFAALGIAFLSTDAWPVRETSNSVDLSDALPLKVLRRKNNHAAIAVEFFRPRSPYLDPIPETDEALAELLESLLSGRQWYVIHRRFGLLDGNPATLADVGRELKVTRERIRQIEQKALRYLRPKLQGGAYWGSSYLK